MTTKTDDLRFKTPLYTLTEAARFLGVPPTTFATWAHGYERHPKGRAVVKGDPILTAVKTSRRHPEIPFVGLVEGMVAAAFRRAGVSMQHMRQALAVLEKEIGVQHALASQKLHSDGASILFDYASAKGDEEILTVVVTGQRVFHDVIRDYLERITYGLDDWAERMVYPSRSAPRSSATQARLRPATVYCRRSTDGRRPRPSSGGRAVHGGGEGLRPSSGGRRRRDPCLAPASSLRS